VGRGQEYIYLTLGFITLSHLPTDRPFFKTLLHNQPHHLNLTLTEHKTITNRYHIMDAAKNAVAAAGASIREVGHQRSFSRLKTIEEEHSLTFSPCFILLPHFGYPRSPDLFIFLVVRC
jgi:hypothetical protein